MGRAIDGGFAHTPVVYPLGGDLCQMGHAQHLAILADLREQFAHHLGHCTTDARIDFIKYQGRHRIDGTGDDR